MAQYNLTREEQETTINWCNLDKTVEVDTADPVMIRRFDKLVEAYPEEYKLISEDAFFNAKRYQMPLKLLSFRNPPSQAQIEANRKKGFKPKVATNWP